MTTNKAILLELEAIAECAYNEARWGELRLEAEKRLLTLVQAPSDGQSTVRLGCWKLTLKRPIRRTVSVETFDEVRHLIPREIADSLIRVKVEPNDARCKYIANNEPEIWRKVAGAFTATPGKVQVIVGAVEGK